MSNVPSWWEALLLLAAAYRVWRLISYDTITETPRTWVLDRYDPHRQRKYFSIFLLCPWCAGFWMTVIWWLAWLVWPHATLVVAVPWALSLAVGLLGSKVDTEE